MAHNYVHAMAKERGTTQTFEEFCRDVLKLNVQNEAVKEAGELMGRLERFRSRDDVFNSSIGDDDRICLAWYCCAVFLTRAVHKRVPEKVGTYCLHLPKLSDLVKATGISLIDLSLELRHVCKAAHQELLEHFGAEEIAAIEQYLNENPLETGLVFSTVLLKKYTDLYLHYFKDRSTHHSNPAEQAGSVFDKAAALLQTDKYFELGLLVFLVVKESLLPPHPDLISLFGCLVATLSFIIQQASEDLLRHPFSDETAFPVRRDIGASQGRSPATDLGDEADVSGCLAQHTKISQEDLEGYSERVASLLQKLLSKESAQGARLLSKELYPGFLLDSESGKLSEPRLNRFTFLLKNEYERLGLVGKVEVDELELLQPGRAIFLGNPSKLCSASIKKLLLPKHSVVPGAETADKTPRTPLRGISVLGKRNHLPFQTPISSAMAASQWLRTMVEEEPICDALRNKGNTPPPGAAIVELFQKHLREHLVDTIHDFLSDCLGKIFPTRKEEGSHHTQIVPEKYHRQAAVLFYRVLLTLFHSEMERNKVEDGKGGDTLDKLVSSRPFLTSLVALASECVVAAHRITTFAFPVLERKLGVGAFDVEKLIDQFVRLEPTIPQDIRRHLHEIEERIIEQFAWEKGSSLFQLLRLAGRYAEKRNSMENLNSAKENAKSDQDFETGRSSREGGEATLPRMEEKQAGEREERDSGWLPHALESVADPSMLNDLSTVSKLSGPEIACAEFIKKAIMLSTERTDDLCSCLQLPARTASCARGIVESVFLKHSNLLYGRHIDQIMLCSLYGACKARRHSIQFKEILIHYRRQHQSRPEVYRNVSIQLKFPSLDVTKKGDIIDFYNSAYVPVMKDVLLHLASDEPMGEALHSVQHGFPRVERGSEPPCSPSRGSTRAGTPKSPLVYTPGRAGSRAQIHVSPIPRQKQERLMAETSEKRKSLFAFFGETTHAYQSPSKDLNFINGCINNQVAGSSYGNALKKLRPENNASTPTSKH